MIQLTMTTKTGAVVSSVDEKNHIYEGMEDNCGKLDSEINHE